MDRPTRDAAHPILLLQRHQPGRLPRGREAQARRGRAIHLRVRKRDLSCSGLSVIVVVGEEITLLDLAFIVAICASGLPSKKSSSDMHLYCIALPQGVTGLFTCIKWLLHQ